MLCSSSGLDVGEVLFPLQRRDGTDVGQQTDARPGYDSNEQ
jgi:hypothetical protein